MAAKSVTNAAQIAFPQFMPRHRVKLLPASSEATSQNTGPQARRRSDGDLVEWAEPSTGSDKNTSPSRGSLQPRPSLPGMAEFPPKTRDLSRSKSSIRILEADMRDDSGPREKKTGRAKSVDFGQWPSFATKFPVDIRPPRYPTRPSPLTVAITTSNGDVLNAEVVEDSEDDEAKDTKAVHVSDDVQIPAEKSAGLIMNPASSSTSKPAVPKAQGPDIVSKIKSGERVRYVSCQGNEYEADKDGRIKCLWPGAQEINWGTSSCNAAQLDDLLVSWRKERASLYYSPTADDTMDRHCSEHPDRTPAEEKKAQKELDRAKSRHRWRHRLTGHCSLRECCMNSSGRELLKKVIKQWGHEMNQKKVGQV